MSLRHLSADRIQEPVPQASPPVMSTYGSMPHSAASLVARAAQSVEFQLKGSLPVTKGGLMHYGALILALICFLPCWDAVQMLRSCNFTQWIGTTIPICMLVACTLIIIFFFSMADGIFRERQGVAIQNVALLCSLFLTMTGLMLIVVSLPLSHQTVDVANDLAYNCHGERARDVSIAYDTLASLRVTPACADLESVEECEGFVASPEVLYLKGMEGRYLCSGFCAREPVAAAPAAPEEVAAEEPAVEEASAEEEETESSGADTVEAVVNADGDTSLLLVHGKLQRHIAAKSKTADVGEEVAKPRVAMLATELNATISAMPAALASLVQRHDLSAAQPVTVPPTLFSRANYQTSCDGAASRDLLNFGREVAWQSWYIGIILLSVSILMGVVEWSNAVLA